MAKKLTALKLDILAIGAHPDDVELSAGGTLIKAVQELNSEIEKLKAEIEELKK